jgi:hypothetical protein
MNEKDHQLFEQLKAQLGDPPVPGPIVLDVRTTQFVRVELILLKALIGEGRPGLFISVDRPHQYMVHLLDMHQIDHRNITFVDAVARFAADRKQAAAKVGFLRGPSNIDTLPEALKNWSSEGGGKAFDLEACSFVVIDNMATLLNFNSQQVVCSFLNEFVSIFRDKITVPLVVDRERNPNLFQMAMSMGGSKIRLAFDTACHPPERQPLKILDSTTEGG